MIELLGFAWAQKINIPHKCSSGRIDAKLAGLFIFNDILILCSCLKLIDLPENMIFQRSFSLYVFAIYSNQSALPCKALSNDICMSGFETRTIYCLILLNWYLPSNRVHSAAGFGNPCTKTTLIRYWRRWKWFRSRKLHLIGFSTVPFDVNKIWAAFHPLMAQGHFNLKIT